MHLLIWSQAICYLFRKHIFVPQGIEPGDELFPLAVLVLQTKYFGPFPEKFFQLLDEEAAAILRYVIDQCGEEKQVFSLADPVVIDPDDPDDKDFICYLMKPDPRDQLPRL